LAKAKAKRVFEIARELNVASKAVVEKCQAEGLDGITNHMSTVKLGLEMTIREWFSESHQTETAVETAEQVDLEGARKARRRRSAKKKEESNVEVGERESGATATATQEPPVTSEPAVQESAEVATPGASPAENIELKEQAEPDADSPVETETLAEQTNADSHGTGSVSEPKPIVPVGQINVPDRPKIVKPVGEQLEKPREMKLKGPRIVRIEQPDPVSPPRPRRSVGGGGTVGSPPRVPGEVPGIARSRGPARGRGAGGPGDGGEREGAGRGGSKRRALSSRRGRSGDAHLLGPTKFSEADMAELDARLGRAKGFVKRRRQDMKKRESGGQVSAAAVVTGGEVEIHEPITIKSLSAATGIKTNDIIRYLFKKKVKATVNSAIETDMAMEVALEYDIELTVREQQSAEQLMLKEFEERELIDERARPAVVTVLGHVDHGKTSLLDRIRRADVASHEAGGITQHVGAYRVTIRGSDGKDKTVVFLDTPGHEAFTSMRARGAGMTDLVVLVGAADDGVMPQTIESINHAKAADVPIVVALNKIDTPQATEENIHKIYGQLAEHGLNPTEWGGETEVIRVSATEGTGVTDLLEVIDYQAELLELKADYDGPARGTVIETEMQMGRGPVARVLVQQGRLRVGDFVVIGRAFGRVRDMTDDRGRSIAEAGPATPVELSGIDQIPDAGDHFYATASLQKSETIAMARRDMERQRDLTTKNKVTLDNLAEQFAAGAMKELRVVLKADVQGSIDVLRKSLEELGNDEVGVRVLHAAVGGITESDVVLADASEAVVVGFHVTALPAVRELAEERGVDIRLYRVIYDVVDDVKKALEGMLEPETREELLGEAEVREVFKISKLGKVAGCLVAEGTIERSGRMRVVRDGVTVTDNRPLDSLRRVKEDVNQVRQGTECGIRIHGFDDVKAGDRLMCYKVVQVKRTLE